MTEFSGLPESRLPVGPVRYPGSRDVPSARGSCPTAGFRIGIGGLNA